ncbi:MAG TPA: efflux RND transporter periplasmic adaptor subunit [Burkholderiales bacterium]|nr:efflux RND transporter periplasmic adaptor subunit [Burkholderiales bacterium]
MLTMWHVVHRAVHAGAVVALLLAVAGCGKGGAPDSEKKSASAGGVAAKPLQLSTVQKQFLTIEPVGASDAAGVLALPGRVTFRPQAQSAVGATTAGRVVALLVRTGEVVKAGAPLLTIESADAAGARAALDQATTRLAVAESVYRRHLEMMEKGVGLEVERQEAEARLKEARTELARARQSVSVVGAGEGNRVTVRAPSNGIVMSIRVALGATVAPGGEALLELGDPTRLQVVAQVPESDLGRVSAGQEAEIELPALAARVAGRVENFNPRVEPESRRAQVYLALTQPVDGMRAGMLAQVRLRVGAEPGITVPVTAVLIKEGKRRVVYVERPDGSFELREVEIGRNQEGRVVVLKGLSRGERVVVRGALLLDTQAEQLL